MSNELEFRMKPRRMISPPQNEQKWLTGMTGVEVKVETEPERMAYFAREATWGDIMYEPTSEELLDTLREVQGGRVLGAAFKDGMGFRIRASRSCMDQALRLAEGSGGAGSGAGAQTTRDNDQRDFNIIIPNTIEALLGEEANNQERLQYDLDAEGVMEGIHLLVEDLLKDRKLPPKETYTATELIVLLQRKVYGALVDAGIPPQDARYPALPLGFQTQWFWIMSRGNLIKLCDQRLCNGLTQHETDYLVRVMRDEVVKMWPWMVDLLRSGCEKRGRCTSGSLLFPPCGAFQGGCEGVVHLLDHSSDDTREEHLHKTSREVMLQISKYDPDKHLYPADRNDAMEFAQWDIERQYLEKERPEVIFSMAGPPEVIGYRISQE